MEREIYNEKREIFRSPVFFYTATTFQPLGHPDVESLVIVAAVVESAYIVPLAPTFFSQFVVYASFQVPIEGAVTYCSELHPLYVSCRELLFAVVTLLKSSPCSSAVQPLNVDLKAVVFSVVKWDASGGVVIEVHPPYIFAQAFHPPIDCGSLPASVIEVHPLYIPS